MPDEGEYVLEEEVLAEGTFGRVRAAKRRREGKRAAWWYGGVRVGVRTRRSAREEEEERERMPKQLVVKECKVQNEEEGCPVSAMREASILLLLRRFPHPHVEALLDVAGPADAPWLVMERRECNLREHVKRRYPDGMPAAKARSCVVQILSALVHCHSMGLLHRDVKPQNVLVEGGGEGEAGGTTLRLADFGNARKTEGEEGRRMTLEVCTLWYKAPELLLGEDAYGFGVDVWSAGCVWRELLSGTAPFRGDSQVHQLFLIFRETGTPTQQTWPNAESLPNFGKEGSNVFPKWRPPSSLLLPRGATRHDARVLSSCLLLDPARRTTAKHALASILQGGDPVERGALHPEEVVRVDEGRGGGGRGNGEGCEEEKEEEGASRKCATVG